MIMKRGAHCLLIVLSNRDLISKEIQNMDVQVLKADSNVIKLSVNNYFNENYSRIPNPNTNFTFVHYAFT